MSQNNETVAMLVSQTNPVGVELFSYGNAFFLILFQWICIDAGHVSESTLYSSKLEYYKKKLGKKNMFIHSHILSKTIVTRIQTEIGEVYTRFQIKTTHKLNHTL